MEYSTNFKEEFLDIMVRDKIPVRKVILHLELCMPSIQQWGNSTGLSKVLIVVIPKICIAKIKANNRTSSI